MAESFKLIQLEVDDLTGKVVIMVRTRELVRHTFNGGRFLDHGIVVEALQDVLNYKNLVVEVAKELWRRNHPDRVRMRRNIDEAFCLRFYAVEQNCATIPLVRTLPTDEQIALWQVEDELDDAVDLVCRTIDAASDDNAIPAEFPKELLKHFNDYGTTLHDDEWIEHRPQRSGRKCRYDYVAKQRLIRWIAEPYEDRVDVTGTVTMARVNRPRMAIEIDGREVEAKFSLEDEEAITTALKDHETAKLRVMGRGQFSAEGTLVRLTAIHNVKLVDEGQTPFDSTAKPIWEEFAELAGTIPKDELAKLPEDGATRLDDYIYGKSKGK